LSKKNIKMTFLNKVNKFIMKYIGFMLYPTTKCGKEGKNLEINNRYDI
jgi:hypothetical protein